MLQNFTLGSFAQGVSAGGGAFESIASATGTGSSTTITFSSIPSTYTSLQVRVLSKCDANSNSNDIYRIRFNSDTGSNYAYHYLFGSGSLNAGGAATQTWINFAAYIPLNGTGITNNHGVAIHDFHEYASTTKYKTVRNFFGSDNNTDGGTVGLSSGLWMSTSAITSISFISDTNFMNTTTFALYGIKGA